jgi:hypothetical protein
MSRLISKYVFSVSIVILVTLLFVATLLVQMDSIMARPFLLVIGVILIIITFYVIREFSLHLDKGVDEIVRASKFLEEKKSKLEKAVDKKTESFLNIPTISFHFANEDEINSYYNDYFKEPTIEQIVSEKASEVSGKVKGGFPKVLEAAAGGKDINKWISTIKLPDISVAEKFRRYQRETIKNNQVTLGLELVDIDLSELDEFNNFVSDFESKFGMKLDDSQVEKQRALLTEKTVERTMIRLESASDWILVEGKFKITNLSDDLYKLIYEHPVNNYFAEEGKKVTMSMILRKDSLKANVAGNYAQSIGKLIPLKVNGKVWKPMNRKEDFLELQITPLAIY